MNTPPRTPPRQKGSPIPKTPTHAGGAAGAAGVPLTWTPAAAVRYILNKATSGYGFLSGSFVVYMLALFAGVEGIPSPNDVDVVFYLENFHNVSSMLHSLIRNLPEGWVINKISEHQCSIGFPVDDPSMPSTIDVLVLPAPRQKKKRRVAGVADDERPSFLESRTTNLMVDGVSLPIYTPEHLLDVYNENRRFGDEVKISALQAIISGNSADETA